MATKLIFLSYCRGPATTAAADRLFRRIEVQLRRDDVVPFLDRRSIEAGDQWSSQLDAALASATHFLALISIDYWHSPQCMRELGTALSRYESGGAPKLLFVLADRLDPNDLMLPADNELAGRIRNLGQINFLGPYDEAGRLTPLEWGSPITLDDQLAKLVASIKRMLAN